MRQQIVDPFVRIKKAFANNLSTSQGNPLQEIGEGETVLGHLKGLTPVFYSEFGRVERFVRHQQGLQKEISVVTQNELEFFEDCYWEAALAEYPEAMKCLSIEIRQGWMLVECAHCRRMPEADNTVPLIEDFFEKVTRIMKGETVIAHPSVTDQGGNKKGTVVGQVRDPIMKQICTLYELVGEAYHPHMHEPDDVLHSRLFDQPHWMHEAYKNKINRMWLHYRIMRQLLSDGFNYEGFENEGYVSLLQRGGTPWLEVKPNWDIVFRED